VNSGSGNVTKINAINYLVGTPVVDMTPRAAAFDGNSIWLTNSLSNNVR
jgi:hypothetical protein